MAAKRPKPALATTASTSASSSRTIESALQEEGLTDCLELLRASGSGRQITESATVATLLCPTNEAVALFLDGAGLTMGELLRRNDMVDKMAAYHLVPFVKAPSSALAPAAAAASAAAAAPSSAAAAAGGSEQQRDEQWAAAGPEARVFAVSGDPHYLLRFSAHAPTGSVLVRDAQGLMARVVKADVDAGASVVHAVDSVLLSGEYFSTLESFANFYGGNFTVFAAALNASGLGDLASHKRWTGTLFAPINSAYDAAAKLAPELTLGQGPSPEGTQKLRANIQYSQLPEVLVYPGDFGNGTSYATRLPGHRLSVGYTIRNLTDALKDNITLAILEGKVVSETGSPASPAPIGLPNLYVGRGVVHGIGGVPLPASPVPSSSRHSQRRRTASPSAAAAALKAAGRHLLHAAFVPPVASRPSSGASGGLHALSGFRDGFHPAVGGGFGGGFLPGPLGAGARPFNPSPAAGAYYHGGRANDWGCSGNLVGAGANAGAPGSCGGLGYTAAALGGAKVGAAAGAAGGSYGGSGYFGSSYYTQPPVKGLAPDHNHEQPSYIATAALRCINCV